MERLLIYIKHHFVFLWKIIEKGNGLLFSLLFKSKMEGILQNVFEEFSFQSISFKRIILKDIEPLYNLIKAQKASDLEYFHPHGFDLCSLKRQLKNKSFLMMGAFEGEKIVGYFFLRFFATGKCFVGRLIDKPYRGNGIAGIMNNIMYETAWRMNFRCLSTISVNNIAVMKAHAKNPAMVILKKLQNNYLLVEFTKNNVSKADI